MFKSEGQHPVKITKAYIGIAPWDKSEQEIGVALHGEALSGSGEQDTWFGSLGEDYVPNTNPPVKSMDMTIQNLEKIGWKHGNKLTEENLNSLVGTETEFAVKPRMKGGTQAVTSNGDPIFDAKYLGPSSYGPKKLSKADAEARIRALFGSGDDDVEDAEVVEPEAKSAEAKSAESANPFG